ncbi:ubiquitin-conjugating enzyme E2 Z-like [Paramacrobiotus metropolitanus]|uniref:ubiquitin-conjugating enzyme E2 Z-like n=1 Tax=Paramacrobiotus metropolitanus TaxID=2943436 RepID=UPI0024460D41|nr:ubiquitin-conjugating enzyme E2 Z-like [Paramacrobiotus metropolitanus]
MADGNENEVEMLSDDSEEYDTAQEYSDEYFPFDNDDAAASAAGPPGIPSFISPYANPAQAPAPAPQNGAVLPPSANIVNWTGYSYSHLHSGGPAYQANLASQLQQSAAALQASAAAMGMQVGAGAQHLPPPPAVGAPPGPGSPANPFMSEMRMHNSWDPLHSAEWDRNAPSDLCLGRIARDLHSLFTDPIPGVVVHAFESNVTKMLALITGPVGTPYEGGFFEFFLRCPPDYPITHPRVRLLTTGGDTVRFNPNLYANGKVCLSLLGTWSGPAWSPALNISSLLLSIQSLMGEFPYRNEPGFEKSPENSPEVVRYNIAIKHETIRVAVIEMVELALKSVQPMAVGAGDEFSKMPEMFRKRILTEFLRIYPNYLRIIDEQMKNTSAARHGGGIAAHFMEGRIKYNWKQLAEKLPPLQERVQAEVSKWNEKADSGMDDMGDS